MNDEPYVIERVYNAPVNKVWDALTQYDQMKQWYFDLPGFKPEVGYSFTFSGGPKDGKQYKHVCRITESIENQRLSYTWQYEGYPGQSEVIFELFSNGEQTRLVLTHKGLSNLDQTNKDFAASNFVAGWEHIIGKSLKGYLERE